MPHKKINTKIKMQHGNGLWTNKWKILNVMGTLIRILYKCGF